MDDVHFRKVGKQARYLLGALHFLVLLFNIYHHMKAIFSIRVGDVFHAELDNIDILCKVTRKRPQRLDFEGYIIHPKDQYGKYYQYWENPFDTMTKRDRSGNYAYQDASEEEKLQFKEFEKKRIQRRFDL